MTLAVMMVDWSEDEVVWVAAATWAALTFEPMVAKSVAADTTPTCATRKGSAARAA